MDAGQDGEPLSAGERRERAAPRGWLEERGDGGYTVSLAADAACAFISAAATGLLPSFLKEHYRLEVRPRDLPEWFDRPPLDLRLRGLTDETGRGFDVERVADGYRLWVQLALLDALEEAERVESFLWRLANEWREVAETMAQLYQAEDPGTEAVEGRTDAPDARFDAAIEAMAGLVDDPSGWLGGELADFLAERPAEDWTTRPRRKTRLYIADEPERHLQPRVQRQAARWLSDTAEARRAPCLIASHSASFLALPSDVASYVFVDRHGEDASFHEFELSDLEELDAVAQTMGFERGELLSLVGVWLVVEGPTDLVVLQRLFPRELHRAGIGVVPIRGTARWQGLLEADALWRYMRVPVAVMFDNVSTEKVRELIEASDEDLRLIEGRPNEASEVKDMARLVRVERETGKTVHPVPNSGTDMLSYLDEQVLKELSDGEYPGHDAAEEAWMKHRKGGRDEFIRRRYGVRKDVETFQRAADLMAERGIRPAELAAAIDYCSRLTEPLRPHPG